MKIYLLEMRIFLGVVLCVAQVADSLVLILNEA